MKKVTDYLKSYALIISGALLFLYSMDLFSPNTSGAGIAIGIIAVVCSVCFLAVGILNTVAGDKIAPMTKNAMDAAAVGLFAVFMFSYRLILTITLSQIENYMSPTAWIIAIVSMIAALSLLVVYIVSRFFDSADFLRFTHLFAAIFALALLLNILFNLSGSGTALGEIDVILAAIYVTFTIYLFDSLVKTQVPAKTESEPTDWESEEEIEEPKEETPAQNDGEQF